MKYYIYICLLLVLTISQIANAQTNEKEIYIGSGNRPTANKDEIHTKVDKQAEYVTGISGLMKFLRDNLEYPKAALDDEIQGTIIVKFVVDTNGNVSNIVTERPGNKLLIEEAFRVVKLLPKWKPAIKDGVPVKSYYRLPIRFQLH